jgi:SAM-dependent methyltransferase
MLNEIVTGDARELAAGIPDESVDLIFTDPIYSEESLYTLLASVALRVLKPAGAVLCWANGKWHRQNANWLEAAGLTYRYDFGCVIATGSAPMNGKIISKTNRVIWLDKDGRSKMRGYLADGYTSAVWSRLYSEWKWTKNPNYCEQVITVFSDAGAVVLDLYTGYGTIPAVAKVCGRQYIGFEIEPDRAEAARQRVAATQAMHPAFLTEQSEMFSSISS